VLIVHTIASGIVCGVNNTVTTQAVMTVSPIERPVASAAYSFVRFIGGGLAPYIAGRLVAAVNIHVPFYVGGGREPCRRRPDWWPSAATARSTARSTQLLIASRQVPGQERERRGSSGGAHRASIVRHGWCHVPGWKPSMCTRRCSGRVRRHRTAQAAPGSLLAGSHGGRRRKP
jgi:hypothetical protein